jgi:hypothetical protein
MTETRLLVDNNLLSQLHAAGGASAWDTLLDIADKVMITRVVYQEAVLADYGAEFMAWQAENQPQMDIKEYSLEQINSHYGTNYQVGSGEGAGDASIRYFVDSGDAAEFDYKLASSDGKLINYFDVNLKTSPYQAVFGFLHEELIAGRLRETRSLRL